MYPPSRKKGKKKKVHFAVFAAFFFFFAMAAATVQRPFDRSPGFGERGERLSWCVLLFFDNQ